MLIHGRLFLTRNGLMLDEVRSLLQKSLRRKDVGLAAACVEELIGGEKDQLPWKSLTTFFFEDHCLAGTDALSAFKSAYAAKDKRRAVEILLQAPTSRVAACLPVVGLDSDYSVLSNVEVPEELKALVVEEEGRLDFDLVLAHLIAAWRARDERKLVPALKLVTLAADFEERTLTSKGMQFLLQKPRGKGRLSLLVLSALHRATEDQRLKKYIRLCYDFASQSVTRLLLSAPVAYLLFQDSMSPWGGERPFNWSTVETLSAMPSHAVDKHTYRGKYGKPSKPLLKEKPSGMTEELFEEFHGERPKRDLQTFFTEGVQCKNETLEKNPYWLKTMEIYLQHKPRFQKTSEMSKLFYAQLQRDGRFFQKCMSPRKRSAEEDGPEPKRPRIEKKPLGPLLQVPTGRWKVYTCIDPSTHEHVLKGPYTPEKMGQALFFHKAMLHVIGDLHTMNVETRENHLVFPLQKAPGKTVDITQRDFFDVIQRSQSDGTPFVARGSLGVIQVHKLSPQKISALPASFWAHFLYRYCLNVGDSGLYNAITDAESTFLYGIDLEEKRGKILSDGLVGYMFAKKPCKTVYNAVSKGLKHSRSQLREIFAKKVDIDSLENLAREHGAHFNKSQFLERVKQVQRELQSEDFCNVCLKDGHDLGTQCGHKFHWDCVENWLQWHRSCPTCGADLPQYGGIISF